MRVGCQHHAPAALLPREQHCTHRVESGGHQGAPERDGKSCPQPGFDPRTVQPIASRYVDYTTSASGVHKTNCL
jgi:hypothetical protein